MLGWGLVEGGGGRGSFSGIGWILGLGFVGWRRGEEEMVCACVGRGMLSGVYGWGVR